MQIDWKCRKKKKKNDLRQFQSFDWIEVIWNECHLFGVWIFEFGENSLECIQYQLMWIVQTFKAVGQTVSDARKCSSRTSPLMFLSMFMSNIHCIHTHTHYDLRIENCSISLKLDVRFAQISISQYQNIDWIAWGFRSMEGINFGIANISLTHSLPICFCYWNIDVFAVDSCNK